MKKIMITALCGLFAVMVFAGCSAQVQVAEAATPASTATATPEPTATPTATATPEPTATPTATATPEPTVTPVPTAEPQDEGDGMPKNNENSAKSKSAPKAEAPSTDSSSGEGEEENLEDRLPGEFEITTEGKSVDIGGGRTMEY